MTGNYQNNISELPTLDSYRYENIFKVYETGDSKFLFYNIIKKIQLPDELNNQYYFTYVLQKNTPWTTLSYQVYGTTYLWWLICITNKIKYPLSPALQGKVLKIIKKEFVKSIVDSITNQLQ